MAHATAVGRDGVERLTLVTADGTATLPFLCSASSFAWLVDRELVVSVGDENGAPLVRVTPPVASTLFP